MAKRYSPAVMAVAAIVMGLLLPLLLVEIVLQFTPVLSGLYQAPVNASRPVGSFEPNRRFTYSIGPTFELVTRGRTNNLGWVNAQDYDSTASSPLVAVVGDSYVEALMVPYEETLHGRLAAALGARSRVYSFGSSGAPLAHYLALAQYARTSFRPARAIVVVVGNDFDESLRRYKVAPGLHGFAEDSAGRLVLQREDYEPSRAKRLLRKSALVRYLVLNVRAGAFFHGLRSAGGVPADSAAFAGNVRAAADFERLVASRRVVDQFLAELPGRAGLAPACIAIVVDGVRPQLYDARTRAAGDASYFGVMRRYMLDGAAAAGYSAVDLQPAFVKWHASSGQRFEYPNDGHWNGLGHAIAADAVVRTPVITSLSAPSGPSCSPTSS
jgi:hypothetical protein